MWVEVEEKWRLEFVLRDPRERGRRKRGSGSREGRLKLAFGKNHTDKECRKKEKKGRLLLPELSFRIKGERRTRKLLEGGRKTHGCMGAALRELEEKERIPKERHDPMGGRSKGGIQDAHQTRCS